MLKFTINNIKREKEIIGITNKHLDFLKGERIKFTLPNKTIEQEYNIKTYNIFLKEVKKGWDQKEKAFTKRLLDFFNKPTKTEFIVEISNYGPLGFYNIKTNTITININTHLDPIQTIKHEMIHIMIELLIKKYHIKHKRKENIVDTILQILENN